MGRADIYLITLEKYKGISFFVLVLKRASGFLELFKNLDIPDSFCDQEICRLFSEGDMKQNINLLNQLSMYFKKYLFEIWGHEPEKGKTFNLLIFPSLVLFYLAAAFRLSRRLRFYNNSL